MVELNQEQLEEKLSELDGMSKEQQMEALTEMLKGYKQKPYVREEAKINRNSKCPCKSGKKYKKCCINGKL